MKVREVLRMLREGGWVLVRQRGSRRQFRHPREPGAVTVAGHPSDEVARGTPKSILRQAALGR